MKNKLAPFFVLVLALLAALVCALAPAPAQAQVPSITASQLGKYWGFIRKAPCVTGQGDACGNNAPTYHLTPDWCGVMVSSGGAKNEDATNSTDGIRYTLPTVAELTAAGYSPAGSAPSQGVANREGQCVITFLNGAPGPQNFLRISMKGVSGSDKLTNIPFGSFDYYDGELVFNFTRPGSISFAWNGTSWIAIGGNGALMEQIGLGQLHSHGAGRLFAVTADPTWWTAGTLVGKLAFCPFNGRGMVTETSGSKGLVMQSGNCAYLDSNTGGSGVDLVVFRATGGHTITSIAQGAAYGAGTAPNGVAYAAGNYAVLVGASAVAFSSGDSIKIGNLDSITALGTKLNGKWIGKKLAVGDPGCAVGPACIELHEHIDEGNGRQVAVPVGPPSAFVAGDSIPAGSVSVGEYVALTTASVAVARITDPLTGIDIDGMSNQRTVVGVAAHTSGIGYQDNATNRNVSSFYNPVEKKCQKVFTADRTTASASFVEPNTEIRCNFIYTSGISAKAQDLGDAGRKVRYAVTVAMSNDTAGAGCIASVGFDGTTPETEVASVSNPTGITNFMQTVTLSGSKSGLSETAGAPHYLTVLVKTTGSGTCKVWKDYTFNTSFHLQ